ncbi:unnamed protein product [Rhizophagus irregularis]|nr:unnamed protein product [Rhizophagus irregularis]
MADGLRCVKIIMGLLAREVPAVEFRSTGSHLWRVTIKRWPALSERLPAFSNYSMLLKCFDLAIKRSEGDKLSELRAMNSDEVSIQRDWEIWLKEKKSHSSLSSKS